MKMVIPLKEKSQKKTMKIPLKKIQEKTTPHTQSVALGIVTRSLEKWICFDGCDMWFKKCTNIKRKVPKVFLCEKCTS